MLLSKTQLHRTQALAFGIALGLVMPLAVAGTNSTQLPNGANLSVTISDPVTSTEYLVPHDESDIDVLVTGSASIGEGEPDVTLVYVIDVSGSTADGTSCATGNILDCEQEAVLNLNTSDGISSVDEVGVVVYASGGAYADMTPTGGDDHITAPDAGGSPGGDVETVVNSTYSTYGGDGGVVSFTPKVAGIRTDFSEGLKAAGLVRAASSNGTNIVIFLSDGVSNESDAGFAAQLDALSANSTLFSFAIGPGSQCDPTVKTHGTLQQIAAASGNDCEPVPDPADLPTILPDLISAWLDAVAVNGVPATTAETLPLLGPGSTSYSATVEDLAPGNRDIIAIAEGHDNSGTGSVTQTETIHMMQLAASPLTADNDLNSVVSHTVTGSINGGNADPNDLKLEFAVMGDNAAVASPSGFTYDPVDDNTPKDFTYAVPQVCESLGTDTIRVTATLTGDGSDGTDYIDLTKTWFDETPPVASCDEGVNPAGKKKPASPGKGGKAQNPDGFYQLNAEDPILFCEVTLAVMDGEGFVYTGPFAPGDYIKYTEDNDRPQGQEAGPGVISWHLWGHGELYFTATDTSGNVSTAVECAVPRPPK